MFVDIIVLEGFLHRQQLPEEDAEGEDVYGKAIGLAKNNLRSHVASRSGQPGSLVLVQTNAIALGELLRQTKIENFHIIANVKAAVVRLQITVNNVVLVKIL